MKPSFHRRPGFLLSLLLAGCAWNPPQVSDAHLKGPAPEVPAADIPAPVQRSASLPPPRELPPVETYNVVVQNVPAQELLFALARDARLNVDVHPSIQGTVSLNALDQTLPQILDRIARQVDMRYELGDGTLSVMPDTPYLQLYKIDYLNMSRDAVSKVAIATQVAAPGGLGGDQGTASNNSSTELSNTANNRFWETLVEAIRAILQETDKILPDTAVLEAPAEGAEAPAPQPVRYREAASVIAHAETGMLAVRATSRQHAKVREFLDALIDNAQRQVLIEATIVEVELKDGYQQGIDWNLLRQSNSRFRLGQNPSGGTELPGGTPVTGTIPALGVLEHVGSVGSVDVALTIRMLENFGRTRVLSSPKISVLNNQTALIKVVDNLVYFTLNVNSQTGTANEPAQITVQSTPNTVPVGFLMNVTPQIGDDGQVTLNLRPTISRLTRYVEDPGVALTLSLARSNGTEVPEISSLVPEIQTREMESIIRVRDGQTAVLGGLMRDQNERSSDEVPGPNRLPLLGELFKYRNDRKTKSELVIFLRPTIVRDPSLQGDYRGFADRLPQDDFFRNPGPGKEDRP
ncbi:MAG: type II and III secretion system protein [Lysobacteraceae bacterium]|nr:MAG: type II and III secretion system protein [Xanthomonadaceae bacterium]